MLAPGERTATMDVINVAPRTQAHWPDELHGSFFVIYCVHLMSMRFTWFTLVPTYFAFVMCFSVTFFAHFIPCCWPHEIAWSLEEHWLRDDRHPEKPCIILWWSFPTVLDFNYVILLLYRRPFLLTTLHPLRESLRSALSTSDSLCLNFFRTIVLLRMGTLFGSL